MSKSEWSDERLEELLKQMPKLKDERDRTEIYQNIALKRKKQRERAWMMPAAAMAAAALLFFILVPNMFNLDISEEKSQDIANESSTELFMAKKADLTEGAEQHANLKNDAAPLNQTEETHESENTRLASQDLDDKGTAVYEEDIYDQEVLTYAIPDPHATTVVPVSIVVEKEENKTKFALYEEHMDSLKEEEWGLEDYYPLHADLLFDETNRVLTVDVPDDHSYNLGSATEVPFNRVLGAVMENFNVKKIKFMTDGEPGIDFSNYGYTEEFIPDLKPGSHAYYFYYPSKSEAKLFITPSEERLNSIQEAFSAMRKDRKEANLFASIPEGIQFEIEENIAEKKLKVRFSDASIINDDEATLFTIEALLLTAKEFNYDTVKFENAKIDQIGRFDLKAEVAVPVAANKRSLTN